MGQELNAADRFDEDEEVGIFEHVRTDVVYLRVVLVQLDEAGAGVILLVVRRLRPELLHRRFLLLPQLLKLLIELLEGLSLHVDLRDVRYLAEVGR
jgi:hypothetical protein